MEKDKEAARGQTLLVIGRRAELYQLGLMETGHIQQAPAPAGQTRVQTASIRVGERRGKEFHTLRWSQNYSWSLKTGRCEPLTFREQRRYPSACDSSSRKEERLCGGVVSLPMSFFVPATLSPPRLEICSCQLNFPSAATSFVV